MPYLTVGKENSGNIDIYYEDHGSGQPVVLIHGWPLSGKSWERQLPVLLQAGYRVITYDRRGFGESAKPSTGYNYDTLAADLDVLLTKLDLTGATIVGFSMGGGEVARYLGQHNREGRVTKAVFLSSIVPALKKGADNPDGVDESVFDEIKQNIVKDRPAFLATFFKGFYSGGTLTHTSDISEEARHMSWNVAVNASPIATYDCVNAWLEDFRPDIERIKIPILVVHGDADKILPIDATGKRTTALIPGSQYVVIEGGSHGCTWTHAEPVNKALLDFLNT